MGPLRAVVHDPPRSLTPLSSVADSSDEVDRLLTGPVTPERSLANDRVDEESDLSPLTSSDEEEENTDTTPRPITRTLRPRGTKVLTSTVEYATPSAQTLSRPDPSPSMDQPSRTSTKRKRNESLIAKSSPTAQKQKPKLDFYVSEDRCHQCRNLPRYAFMRCTARDESGKRCGRLFCVSCITKRYPTCIDFNPQSKKWKCPFCGDTCNCTKCCFKRNVKYTSTANVRIDQDTLLHYAALMPKDSNSTEQPPPPRKFSKSTKKLRPKLTREPTKTKPVAKNDQTPLRSVALNPVATRDIESVIRGLADTAAMFEKFGCVSGEYWGVVFSNIDGGRIGVAYVGDKLPDIFLLKDDEDGSRADEPPPPPTKRLRVSSRVSA